tara:strand:+ start:140 stop:436 length:297 start_codon:yes stop_codon:yes gene_type:complete
MKALGKEMTRHAMSSVLFCSDMDDDNVHLDRETLEQLRVMASEMTAMQKDIASLRIDVSDLSENMKISLHATASLSRMMGSIIQAATRVPLLLVVLPE